MGKPHRPGIIVALGIKQWFGLVLPPHHRRRILLLPPPFLHACGDDDDGAYVSVHSFHQFLPQLA